MHSTKTERAILAFCIFAVASVTANRLPAEEETKSNCPPDQYFDQYLDHFTVIDNRQWKQRYQVITDYYKDKGPVFLELAANWEISGDTLLYKTATAYAQKFGGMVFQLEQRFFGKSHPTSDVSTENLAYLSADQVLADTAYFIEGMNKEHKLPEGTKWIVVGISFAGKLAAWMREKYPHLVYGAVANSAILEAKFNFHEYYNNVRDTLASINPQCVTTVQEAHNKLKELLKTPEGQKIVNEKFKLCNPIDTSKKNDVLGLIIILAENLSEVARYNGSDAYGTLTINGFCDTLLDTSIGEPIDRYAAINSMFVETGGCQCTQYEQDSFIADQKKTSWEDDMVAGGSRQWFYTDCTQGGYFATSTHDDDFFFKDIPYDFFVDRCKAIYGDVVNKDLLTKAETRSNLLFGGKDCQATRVAYVYSSVDPYRSLGLSETKIAESPVFMIQGGYHDAMSLVLGEDAQPAVIDTWNQVQDLVGKWCSS